VPSQQENQSLQAQLSHSKNEKEVLQGDVEHALILGKLQKGKAKKIKTENQDLRSRVAELKSAIESCQTELTELRSISSDTGIESTYLRQQLTMAQSEVGRKTALLDTVQVQVDALNADVQEKATSLQQLQDADRRKTRLIEKLQKKLAAIQTDESSVQAKASIIEKSQQIDDQEEQIQQQQEKIRTLESTLCQARAESKTLQGKCEAHESHINDLKKRLDESRSNLKNDHKEIQRLLNLNADLTSERSALADTADDARLNQQRKITDLTQQLRAALSRDDELEADLDQHKSALEETLAENDKLKTENQQMQREAEEAAKTIGSERNQRQERLDKLQTENEKLTQATRTLDSENRQLAAELGDARRNATITRSILEKRVAALAEQLSEVQSRYDQEVPSLEHKADKLGTELQGKQIANREYGSVFRQLSSLCRAQTTEGVLLKVSELIESHDDLQKELAETRRQLNTSRSERETAKSTLDDLTMGSADLERQVRALTERVQYLQETHSTEHAELLDATARLSREKEEHESTRESLNEITNELALVRSMVQADSIKDLTLKVEQLVGERTKSMDGSSQTAVNLNVLRDKAAKLSKENAGYRELVDRQANDIKQLARQEKELRAQLIRVSKESSGRILELESRAKASSDNQLETEQALTTLRDLLPFHGASDLVSTFTALTSKKDREIEQLVHNQQKLELRITAQQQ
jgi:chromosome segregation ATPase